jgi:hypothetical protein
MTYKDWRSDAQPTPALVIEGSPGAALLGLPDEVEWEEGDTGLTASILEHGGSRAQLVIDHRAADDPDSVIKVGTELTLEDLVLLRDWADESVTFWKAQGDA